MNWVGGDLSRLWRVSACASRCARAQRGLCDEAKSDERGPARRQSQLRPIQTHVVSYRIQVVFTGTLYSCHSRGGLMLGDLRLRLGLGSIAHCSPRGISFNSLAQSPSSRSAALAVHSIDSLIAPAPAAANGNAPYVPARPSRAFITPLTVLIRSLCSYAQPDPRRHLQRTLRRPAPTPDHHQHRLSPRLAHSSPLRTSSRALVPLPLPQTHQLRRKLSQASVLVHNHARSHPHTRSLIPPHGPETPSTRTARGCHISTRRSARGDTISQATSSRAKRRASTRPEPPSRPSTNPSTTRPRPWQRAPARSNPSFSPLRSSSGVSFSASDDVTST